VLFLHHTIVSATVGIRTKGQKQKTLHGPQLPEPVTGDH
jgi:hypothetical protein